MAQAQDMLRVRSDVRPIVSKGMGTQEQLGDQSSSYYASGKHFVGNDGFIYEATKDIQVGDTISVGTLATNNCIKTDLCTVIDALDGNIPTKTSDLTNDSGFITNTVNNLVSYYLKTETYSKTEVDAIATAIKNSRFEVVATLPTTNIKTNVIYLVPTQSSTTSNVKDEYINLNGTTTGWEMIGSTSVDLSGYVTTTQLNTALADYVTSASLTTILADYVQSSSLGTAATKNFTDQVTSGSTDLVTSGAVSSSVQALANEADDTNNILGAKNILPVFFKKEELDGVTFTPQLDGSIDVHGTATAAISYGINVNEDYAVYKSNTEFPFGNCILSGGINNEIILQIYWSNDGSTYGGTINDKGEGALIPDKAAYSQVFIFIASGTVLNHQRIYPMIRPKNIKDNTYAPYAMTNKNLTDTKANKSDITSIIRTGDKNDGSQIANGSHFYLNGEYVKAISTIASNAYFQLNSNYVKVLVGDEIEKLNSIASSIVIEEKNITANFDSNHIAGGEVDVSKAGYIPIAVGIGHTGANEIYPFMWYVTTSGIFHYSLHASWQTGNIGIKARVTYIKSF